MRLAHHAKLLSAGKARIGWVISRLPHVWTIGKGVLQKYWSVLSMQKLREKGPYCLEVQQGFQMLVLWWNWDGITNVLPKVANDGNLERRWLQSKNDVQCVWLIASTGRAAIWALWGCYSSSSPILSEFEGTLDSLVLDVRGWISKVVAGDFNTWTLEWGSRENNVKG